MLNEAPGVQFLDDDEWDALVTLQDCLQPFNELAEFVSTTLDTTANPIISFEDNSNEAFNLAKGIGGNNRRPIVSGDDVEDTDVTRSRTDAKDCSDDDSTDDEDADVILNDDGEYEGNGGLDILDHVFGAQRRLSAGY
ncbi:hypothetical protein BGZ73_005502 [Actinomortierella ambigua]|nr:hypothetical protein BGZ73_005502 [Actinomortierella ambigua]